MAKEITCEELAVLQKSSEIVLLDVRLNTAKAQQPLSIVGALSRDPESIDQWLNDIPTDRVVVVFCAHGRSVSQSTAERLEAAGKYVSYLSGGLAAWMDQGRLVFRLEN